MSCEFLLYRYEFLHMSLIFLLEIIKPEHVVTFRQSHVWKYDEQ